MLLHRFSQVVTLCCDVKRHCILVLSTWALAFSLSCYIPLSFAATVFGLLEPQYVSGGQLLEIPLKLSRTPDVRLQIRLLEAPKHLRLEVNKVGEFVVRWETPTNLPLESLVVIAASDVDSGETIDVRHLLIRNADQLRSLAGTDVVDDLIEPALKVVDDEQLLPATEEGHSSRQASMPGASAKSNDNSTSTLAKLAMEPALTVSSPVDDSAFLTSESPTATRSDNTSSGFVPSAALPRVSILDVANQIVSTGRTVVLTIEATSSDGAQPVIDVDRLPKNASFEENGRGSYTLFWPTGDPDQGEHLFRFTARHANDAMVRDVRDVMIVVGDPARGKTIPQEMR